MRDISPAFLTVILAAVMALPVDAQTGVVDGNWPVYGGDPGHTRYSALDQIDASNADDLEIAWRWSARNYGPNALIRSATTPLMVNGVLYATAGQRRAVVELNTLTDLEGPLHCIVTGQKLFGKFRLRHQIIGMLDQRIVGRPSAGVVDSRCKLGWIELVVRAVQVHLLHVYSR